jgi:hypothetical protein
VGDWLQDFDAICKSALETPTRARPNPERILLGIEGATQTLTHSLPFPFEDHLRPLDLLERAEKQFRRIAVEKGVNFEENRALGPLFSSGRAVLTWCERSRRALENDDPSAAAGAMFAAVYIFDNQLLRASSRDREVNRARLRRVASLGGLATAVKKRQEANEIRKCAEDLRNKHKNWSDWRIAGELVSKFEKARSTIYKKIRRPALESN